MSRWRAGLGAALILTAPVAVFGFEGTLKLRTVLVDRSQLAKVTGGAVPDPAQALAITPKQILDAKDAGGQSRESMVYVSGNKVRMDTPLEKNKDGYAIVDTDKNTTWFVVPSEKRYIEWSEADAKAMGEKMVQMEKMLKERMATLPPEQRAQVETMLKKMKAGNEGEGAPKVDVKATGKTETINGMESAAFEVKTGDETLLGWVTQDQPELAKMLRNVQQRMEKMTPPSMRGRQSARTAIGEKGFPVRVQTLDPEHYRIEEVLAVEKKNVPADLFVVPKDFTKTTAREAMKNAPEK
jgi:hypothetical protein